jgi:hypothetical protein
MKWLVVSLWLGGKWLSTACPGVVKNEAGLKFPAQRRAWQKWGMDYLNQKSKCKMRQGKKIDGH